MSQFLNDVIHAFYINIHTFQENNWDHETLSHQMSGNDHTNKQLFIVKCFTWGCRNYP
jgi:hypothetical protein